MITPLTVVQAQAIAAMRDEKSQESLHQTQQMVLIRVYISLDFIIILTFRRNTSANKSKIISSVLNPTERGFTVGKDVFGISRMSLNPETLEPLVCLRSWYRA